MLPFRWLFERTRKKMPRAIRARAATPPTTPPTMGPMGVEEEEEDCGTGGLVGFGPMPLAGVEVVRVRVLPSSEVEEDEEMVETKILSVPAATPQPRRV